jgi:hypothetical protein
VVIMSEPQSAPEIAARINRIEHGLTRGAPLWSQDDERASIVERMAFYTTPGLSVAVINNGELEWARGYGVLEACTWRRPARRRSSSSHPPKRPSSRMR